MLGPFYFTGVFWYRFSLFGVRILPEWLMGVFVRGFSCFFFLVLGRLRRAVAANLDLVMGPAGWWRRQLRAYRTIRVFTWCFTERYEQFVPDKAPKVRVEDSHVLDELVERGQGFLLVTSHIGNWEVGSALATSAHHDLVIHVVREPELDLESQKFNEKLVSGLGGARYRTHFAGDDISIGPILLDALRRGEVVALQGDRPRAGGQVVSVPMLGCDYDLPLGPVALARLAGVPLLPVFTLREGRSRYRVVFRDPIHVAHTADRDADHRQALQQLAGAIEWAVRTAPEQWFCFAEVGQAGR
jgi:KDO2-lipid IV(A) lauroyltransferase